MTKNAHAIVNPLRFEAMISVSIHPLVTSICKPEANSILPG